MLTLSPEVRHRTLHVVPVVVAAGFGAAWIAVHTQSGRGQVHTVFQVLTVAEYSAALLLRRRKPIGALAGVLLVYVLFQLYAITLLPALLALFTVALSRDRRTVLVATAVTTAVVAVMPYLTGDHPGVLASLGLLAGAGGSAAAGRHVRARQQLTSPDQAGETTDGAVRSRQAGVTRRAS